MTQFDKSETARSRKAGLFVISTGTLSTAHLPFWLNWLSANRPHYSVTVGLTDSAKQFVSSPALTALTKTPVVPNSWDTGDGLRPVHTEIAIGYDGIVVYPASVAFLSGLAAGSGTSPFFLAALGTRAPVVIAPSFPPGVADNPIVADVLARIASVPNFHLVAPHKGKSRSVDAEADVTAPLWDAIGVFEAAAEAVPVGPVPAEQR
ncbi:flavoprotein [Streptomyces natalensis]|uniref:flavoprotein n=1 Tax=Streptomyces natalensis TaxID=68242 RepID=UPI0005C8E9CF|nr:flavoprotein [Streptomyces natalensis]